MLARRSRVRANRRVKNAMLMFLEHVCTFERRCHTQASACAQNTKTPNRKNKNERKKHSQNHQPNQNRQAAHARSRASVHFWQQSPVGTIYLLCSHRSCADAEKKHSTTQSARIRRYVAMHRSRSERDAATQHRNQKPNRRKKHTTTLCDYRRMHAFS